MALVQIQDLLIDLSAAWAGWSDSLQPLGFVDLDSLSPEDRIDSLPPFPLIGLGDPTHPAAEMFDAVVEAPISAAALVQQVEQSPKAAALAAQLLRSIDGLAPDRALTLESIGYGLLQGSAEYAAWLSARPAVDARSAPGRLHVERQNQTLLLTIDRPWARNAIDQMLRDQLVEAFTLAHLDPEISAVRLRSIGPAFSMGGDLEEFGTTRDPAAAHLIRSRTLPALAVSRCADIFQTHVQGGCVGAGLEIAAFASRLTASPKAWFQLPELSMGLIPGAGGCVSLPRRIGRQRTALLILSGRRINAATALDWGLVDSIEDAASGNEGRPDEIGR